MMETLTELECVPYIPFCERELVKVVRVVDGDTFVCARPPRHGEDKPVKAYVRIREINAPELRHAGGDEAKVYLTRLVNQRLVVLSTLGMDHFGRVLAHVHMDDEDVAGMIRGAGHAVHYKTKKE